MNNAELIDRGAKATRLLEDPLLQESFANVRKAIHERWERAPISDREGQHELRIMLHLVDSVEGFLREAITNGKIAADEDKRANALVRTVRKLRGK